MTQTFTIPGRLPGYNELHKHPWQAARRVKQEAMDAVIWAAREARLQPVQGRCVVKICCYEPNRRRDVDNVKAGANKVILDALQQMGILKGDGQKNDPRRSDGADPPPAPGYDDDRRAGTLAGTGACFCTRARSRVRTRARAKG